MNKTLTTVNSEQQPVTEGNFNPKMTYAILKDLVLLILTLIVVPDNSRYKYWFKILILLAKF